LPGNQRNALPDKLADLLAVEPRVVKDEQAAGDRVGVCPGDVRRFLKSRLKAICDTGLAE